MECSNVVRNGTVVLRIGREIAMARFRRLPKGWVFRAPVPWVLGPHPHYLVNEAEKAEIESVLCRNFLIWSSALVVILPLAWLVLPSILPISLLHSTSFLPPLVLIWSVLTSLIIGLLHNLHNCFALQPLLRSAPRTAERVTVRDRAAHVPETGLKVIAVVCVLAFFLSLLDAVRGHDLVFSLAALALAVTGFLYSSVMLRLKSSSPNA
jgi:hypothetical protein